MPVKGPDGMYDIDALEQWLKAFYEETTAVGIEHYVMPRALYLSHPTELGTLYTRRELMRLRELCDQYGLYLYIDGARLGYGLMAQGGDLTLPDIARYCDVFYIGGTKVGALMGEAVVVTNPNIELTRGLIKHRGAMLAKGWLLGVQFDTLFTGDLYLKISRNAVDQAMRLRRGMELKGYKAYIDSPTNQQFFVMSNNKMEELAQKAAFDYITPAGDGHSVVRFATSWATTSEQVDALLSLL